MKRIINRLKGFDFKRMIRMIKVIQKRSNHSFLHIFLDIFRCFILYGSGYMDYYLFYFEDLTDEEKSTYINQAVNKNYIRKCNNPKYYDVLNDKGKFLKEYKDFIKRDFIDLRDSSYDDYVSFVNKHPVFVAKPIDGLCGYGVEIIDTNSLDIKDLYTELLKKEQKLLEEKIDQNDEINSIYDKSINTIRVVTLNKDDDVKIMFTAMRIGNAGKVVDNFNNGGLMAIIDDDGVIRKPILDKDNNVYEYHPYTNTRIVGFKIPRFEEIINLCKSLARVTPELGLCGWDIAVTKSGIDVVEGNHIPGYDIYQSREQIAPSKLGLKPKFDDAIFPELKNKKYFFKGFNFIKIVYVMFIGLLIEYLLSLINIYLPITFLLTVPYIFVYKHLDKFKFKSIIFILLIISFFHFLLEYGITNYAYFVSQNSSSILNYLKFAPIDALVLLLINLLEGIILGLFNLYFVLPFLNKIIEKLNFVVGVILSFVFVVIDIFYLITFFYIFILATTF